MIVHWILISVCFLSLSLAIWKISNNKTDKTVLRCGVALIFVGLFCSLYAYLAPKSKPDDAEIELLKNFFLIISSIGANLLASSVHTKLLLVTHRTAFLLPLKFLPRLPRSRPIEICHADAKEKGREQKG